MGIQPAWECDRCPERFVITDPDQEKVDALADYHRRTKHGKAKVYGPAPKQSTGSTVADAIGDIFEGIGEALGSIFD